MDPEWVQNHPPFGTLVMWHVLNMIYKGSQVAVPKWRTPSGYITTQHLLPRDGYMAYFGYHIRGDPSGGPYVAVPKWRTPSGGTSDGLKGVAYHQLSVVFKNDTQNEHHKVVE